MAMGTYSDPDRLAALGRSGLLDKSVPDRIQHLVYTAHSLLRADVAQLNVLTASTQHTVAEWPRVPPRTRPIAETGCQHVLVSETVAVQDMVDDPIMCVLPWSNHFRGYIGSVICYGDQPIGALCALTVEPRRWTKTDELTLKSLTRLVSLSLEESEYG